MSISHALRALIANQVAAVRAINLRYARPRLTISPAVRWALLSLRVYLLTLVGLLAYKFITVVMH
jgi:hypothetical protein